MNLDHNNLIRRLAFASYRNVTLGNANELIARGAGPDAFFDETPERLASRTGLRIEYFDTAQRNKALEKAKKEADFIEQNHIRAIFCTDPDYPTRLASCDDAPAMIFVLGNTDLNPHHCIAVVGTRHATSYGIEFTKSLIEDLAGVLGDNLHVVSGLAYGIDITAHSAALTEGIVTGAVVAHGLNTIYPADHRQKAMQIVQSGGFLMTEYPTWGQTHRGNFLARNRIVAAISDAVIVVESDLRGGAMSTARIASAYSREVFTLPGRTTDLYSRGCLDLLAREIAHPIRDARDLLAVMNWKTSLNLDSSRQLSLQLDLPEDKIRLLRLIHDNPELCVNDFCARLGLQYSRISSMLFELEMDDLTISLPGGRYSLTPSAIEYLSSLPL